MNLAFDQRECPTCGKIAAADFVDNGVGMQQSGPFGCEACGWVEPPPTEIADLLDVEEGFDAGPWNN